MWISAAYSSISIWRRGGEAWQRRARAGGAPARGPRRAGGGRGGRPPRAAAESCVGPPRRNRRCGTRSGGGRRRAHQRGPPAGEDHGEVGDGDDALGQVGGAPRELPDAVGGEPAEAGGEGGVGHDRLLLGEEVLGEEHLPPLPALEGQTEV